jgi:hypothetical protein
VAFGLRMTGRPQYPKAAISLALLVLYAVGAGLATWVLAIVITGLLVLLCGVESVPGPNLRQRRAANLGLP